MINLKNGLVLWICWSLFQFQVLCFSIKLAFRHLIASCSSSHPLKTFLHPLVTLFDLLNSCEFQRPSSIPCDVSLPSFYHCVTAKYSFPSSCHCVAVVYPFQSSYHCVPAYHPVTGSLHCVLSFPIPSSCHCIPAMYPIPSSCHCIPAMCPIPSSCHWVLAVHPFPPSVTIVPVMHSFTFAYLLQILEQSWHSIWRKLNVIPVAFIFLLPMVALVDVGNIKVSW